MWTANLFQVTTGAIGPRVNFKGASWSISINNIESLSIEVSKADLPNVDLDYWISPWWAGVLYCWNGTPIFAGPIIAMPTETFYGFRLECKGIRAVLQHRFVIKEQEDWAYLAASKVRYDALSFGTIAQRVVRLCMEKPGGSLPISFPLPESTAPGDKEHQRTYAGYNLGNINGDQVLDKLSSISNGPDIMFRPKLVDGNTLTFEMWHGLSEAYPYIPQTKTPVWDTTAVQGEVTDLDMTTTGTYQVNRVFATGANQNESLIIRMAMDAAPITQGYPLLESVESYGDIKNRDIILSHAKANLAQNSKKLVEIQATVRADGEHRLGTFWPGDRCQLVIKGWRSLPDGVHNMRLLNMNGSDDNNVRMSLQTER